MTPLRLVLVDDELQARKRLARLLESIPNVAVAASCSSAKEALAFLATDSADIILLDISMPDLTGLEARSHLPASLSVIFVTAHAEHAVDAFDVGAVDYVLKPVTADRLAKAIARVVERREAAAAAALAAASRPIARIAIETRTGTVLIDPATIIYAVFDGTLVTLVASPTQSWVTTHSLTDLESQLGPDFARVDRRHVLNLREVMRLEPLDTGGALAITRGGLRVPVSRQARRDLAKRFDS